MNYQLRDGSLPPENSAQELGSLLMRKRELIEAIRMANALHEYSRSDALNDELTTVLIRIDEIESDIFQEVA